ncbi:hypothetical protein F4820DRAFT_433250 [Hypoxylon rubiginosum]|uniref:Uncharacterized protein n=1 Tax=Hypoxylon rubiginosum TaxID=110542 RepID=A0ACB9YQ75_9PEZI|nr:hypothetical protein F4820DRAFT_433250 [Hypoxylon rubiginosum]
MTKGTVAVLSMKDRKLMELDKKSIEREEKSTLDLPRWKRTVGVSLIDAKSDEVSLAKGKHDNVIATVDLWRLGIGYNINRMLGNSQQLYVITR